MTKHYLLFYDVVPDYTKRREPLRAVHLQHAQKSVVAGHLVLAGALADPVDSAVLLFRADSVEIVRQFAEADPYVLHGIVTHWRVREWTTVVGEGATACVPQ